MRIAVLGAGAMGSLYGGALASIGHEVTFIDVSSPVIEAINQNGLHLTTDAGTKVIPVKAAKIEDVKSSFDWLILFTKTIHSAGALQSARHILDGDICVLTLQNGLGNRELIQQFVSPERIVVGMTGYPADLIAPGVVSSHGSSFTAMMDASGKPTDKTRILAEEITLAGLNCKVTDQVFCYIWEKVSFNSAMNALTSITHLPVGPMAELGGAELCFAVAREGVATAHSLGIMADEEKVLDMLRHAFVDHYNHKPSMLQDVLAGRQTEARFINGAIAQAAKSVGKTAPINETLYALVDILQRSYDKRLS